MGCAQEQPLLSAAAHALLVCLIILVSADLVMCADACRCRPGWRPPSRALAVLTVPVLMVSTMLAPAIGYSVPPTSAASYISMEPWLGPALCWQEPPAGQALCRHSCANTGGHGRSDCRLRHSPTSRQ